MRFTAGESFMPLSIDRLGKNRISIAHNYEQNGDLMADPDMTFVIDREAGALSARTYQQAGIGRYQTVEDENGNISNAGLAGQLDSFARQWFSNIRKQQFEKSLMRVLSQGEEIDVVFGPEGKVTEITGPDAAVDAYARKIGIEPPPYEDEAGAPSRSIRLTRIGDFYEAYGEDAQTLTELLNLSLTPRQGAAMCGFPDRLLDEYATRLKEVGYAFALTEVSAKGTAITPSASLMSETEGSGEKSEPQNFVSTDEAGVSGKTKYRRNVEAIKLLRAIEAEGRNAAAQEQETLSRYSGWGSLPQVFDPEPKPEWRREWAELKTLLTGKEYDLAAGSTLNAHYTPIEVVTMSTR
jgi:hypothetical protein